MVQPTNRRLVTEASGATLYTQALDNAAVSTDGALAVQKLTKVDATAAARSMTIPDGTIKGQVVAVEKMDAGANLVTVTGKIRSTGSSSITLTYQYETLMLVWGGTYWEPLAAHRTKSSIDTQIAAGVGASQQATAVANSTYGNDSTDAKTHFQGLMNTLSAAGGGLLLIPRGIYRVSGSLFVPSNVTVRGEGRSTVLKATMASGCLIYNANVTTTGDSDITVSDLTVDGAGITNQGVTYAGVKRGTINNVRVKNCIGYGIWLWAAAEGSGSQGIPTEQVTVSNCHVTDVVDTGIEADASIGCTIVGNTVEGTAGRALYAWNGATDTVFANNIVNGVGTNTFIAFQVGGLTDLSYTRQTARTQFIGNTARNVKKGFVVTSTTGNVPTDTSCVGNMMQTALSSSNGVELGYATRVQFNDNHVEGFAMPLRICTPSSGGVPGTARDVQITNNRFYGGASSDVYGIPSGQINNNQFVGQTNHVLNIYAATGMTINGNTFTDAGSANTIAILIQAYGGVESVGNVCIGNRTVDTRATKWLGTTIALYNASDYNILIGNSAKGARTGGLAYQNSTTGTNNVAVNNINA